MEQGQLNWVANFIWGIADDVLRDSLHSARLHSMVGSARLPSRSRSTRGRRRIVIPAGSRSDVGRRARRVGEHSATRASRCKFLALRGGQAGAAVRPLGPGSRDPQPERRRREIQVAGDRPDRLPLIQDQPDGLAPELLVKLSPGSPAFRG
jgi:hypothetical protein